MLNQSEGHQLHNLTDFVTGMGDCLHDCGNAFGWGMKPYMSTETSKDLFVSISAVRNSYAMLMENIHEWLRHSVCFTDPELLPSANTLQELWEALGLEPDVIEQLVHFRMIFKDGKLHISSDVRPTFGGQTTMDEVVGMLTAVWRFVKFSDSRFLTVGPSCKALVSSCMLGLSHMIHWLRKTKHVSEYYIHGWDRLTTDVWQVALLGSLGSGVAESLMAELLEDDRVMLRLDALHECVAMELQAVSLLSPQVIKLLCSEVPCGGLQPQEFHSRIMHCSAGFAGKRQTSTHGSLPKATSSTI